MITCGKLYFPRFLVKTQGFANLTFPLDTDLVPQTTDYLLIHHSMILILHNFKFVQCFCLIV